MKKIILLLLFAAFICSEKINAQDTLRICGCSKMDFVPVPCSPNIFLVAPSFAFAGDTGDVSRNDTVCPGNQGVMDVWCSLIGPLGAPDFSYYAIAAAKPQICVITSDSLNHTVIYIDSASLYGHSSLSLKRKVNSVTWQTIAVFQPTDILAITDNAVNTSSQSYSYRLESNDFACTDTVIQTLHLQANGNNLSWNEGGGIGLRGYYIYKRTGTNPFTLIDSTANLTYTDITHQAGDEYFVEALKDGGCQYDFWRSSTEPFSVKSNRLKIGTTGQEEIVKVKPRISIADELLSVDMPQPGSIVLFDVSGRELANQYTSKLSVRLTPGLYILSVDNKAYKVLMN